MVDCLLFYMDDSGSKNPDHNPGNAKNQVNWFGLGGVLVRESDYETANRLIADFRLRWPQLGESPLHSYDIRHMHGDFQWLSQDDEIALRFREDLSRLLLELPAYVIACVIDRPGYNARYQPKYGAKRWSLCKTAFVISVERAAKIARHMNLKLRVYVERSDKNTEQILHGYYRGLREDGLPFDVDTSAGHAPLDAASLRETLYEFRVKTKRSLLMQTADLTLWPVCLGGYKPKNAALDILRQGNKLADTLCAEHEGLRGIKYSCFQIE